MERISFELEAVTPMFLGGADPENGPPEFRPSSIKGLLRFWYRAIYPDYNLTEEDLLFGSTDNRSPFSLRGKVLNGANNRGKKEDNRWKNSSISYLGYGPMLRGVTKREFFDVGTRFRLDFSFRTSTSPDDKQKIYRAFWALCAFGGLGSRSRRGFGSVKVMSLQQLDFMQDSLPFHFQKKDEFKEAVRNFVKLISRTTGVPKHTAFSDKSQVILTKESSGGQGGILVLKELGNLLQTFRSYKRDNSDHDLMLSFLKGTSSEISAPLRAAFGLPHNYYFSRSLGTFRLTKESLEKLGKEGIPENILNKLRSLKDRIECSKSECIQELEKRVGEDLSSYKEPILKLWKGMPGGVDLLQDDGTQGRRASPIFFHIQGFADGTACGVVTYLPAQFIPDGKKLHLSGNAKDADVDPPGFKAIEDFIDYLVKNGGERII